MTSLTLATVAHGFDGAGEFFFGGELFGGGGDGGGVGADDAALLFLDFAGGFFDVRGALGAEVVGRFEALAPGGAVHVGEGAHVGIAKEEVHALALINPLLAAGGGVDDPGPVDGEGGGVFALEVDGDFLDGAELAIRVLEAGADFGGPEAAFFEVADEVGVQDHEVTGEVALGVHVREEGLDAR